MDIEEAEALVLAAVEEAFGEFMAEIARAVFADVTAPDWLMWPVQLWQELVDRVIIPVIRRIFELVLRAESGIVDEGVLAAMSATFVGQDLPSVVEATTIPDQTQAWLFAAFTAGTGVAALLVASAAVWQPMLGVMARNGGATAVNAAVFSAARWLSDLGRRRVVKTWIAHDDERTRVSHMQVDNTTVLVDDVFNVGGFPLRFPHDPFGPVQEVVNCRCRLVFGERNG